MPARDQCEPQVIRALERAGWIVVYQPFPMRISSVEGVYADLLLKNARNKRSIIILEIKCFSSSRSVLDEFYHAVGQYMLYKSIMNIRGITAPLYLSVPSHIYEDFFSRQSVRGVVIDAKIKLVVIDIDREEVAQWIN